MKRLLVIDDEKDILLLLSKFFSKKGYQTAEASTGEEGISWLKDNKADVVLCDFRLPDYDGLEILQKIKVLQPEAKVVIITGYSDVRIAVKALKKGAADYVTKPLYPDEILATVESALKFDSNKGELKKGQVKSKEVSTHTFEFLQGSSEASKTVQKHIDLIAPTEMSVIILGETGTGKEFAARSIHHQSNRRNQPFVAVDCGAIPKELAGSELFGHIKGAFTGAVQNRTGCFEQANGGTLFLDEIGNLSYDNQIKLLRVLQERKLKKLGDSKEVSIDVRVIVATNEDLMLQVRKEEFREDLYYRLNEFKIELRPLRERKRDIELFANHFLKEANTSLGREITSISEEAIQLLQQNIWHGNLRELKNVIKRAVLLEQGRILGKDVMPQEVHDSEMNQHWLDDAPDDLKSVVEQAERDAIVAMLEKTRWNKSLAAKRLKIDRKTLYNKMSAYGIERK